MDLCPGCRRRAPEGPPTPLSIGPLAWHQVGWVRGSQERFGDCMTDCSSKPLSCQACVSPQKLVGRSEDFSQVNFILFSQRASSKPIFLQYDYNRSIVGIEMTTQRLS